MLRSVDTVYTSSYRKQLQFFHTQNIKAKEAKKLVIKDGYTYVKSSALTEQEKNWIEELELGTQIIQQKATCKLT